MECLCLEKAPKATNQIRSYFRPLMKLHIYRPKFLAKVFLTNAFEPEFLNAQYTLPQKCVELSYMKMPCAQIFSRMESLQKLVKLILLCYIFCQNW